MMNVGQAKGKLVTDFVKKHKPKHTVELGAYCGYSAVKIGRELPNDGKMYSIELDPLNAAIATKVIEWAGLKNKIEVLIGVAKTRIPWLKE